MSSLTTYNSSSQTGTKLNGRGTRQNYANLNNDNYTLHPGAWCGPPRLLRPFCSLTARLYTVLRWRVFIYRCIYLYMCVCAERALAYLAARLPSLHTLTRQRSRAAPPRALKFGLIYAPRANVFNACCFIREPRINLDENSGQQCIRHGKEHPQNSLQCWKLIYPYLPLGELSSLVYTGARRKLQRKRTRKTKASADSYRSHFSSKFATAGGEKEENVRTPSETNQNNLWDTVIDTF